MKTVRQLVTDKSPVVWSIEPDRPVIDAITIMAEKEIDSAGTILQRDASIRNYDKQRS